MSERFPIRRIITDAVLIALFFALSLLSIELPGVRLSFSSLAIVVGAMAFGPLDGFLVGFLGELLAQMLKYGFTATTVLWLLPAALRGLTIGLGARLFRKQMAVAQLRSRSGIYFAVCLAAAVITSAVNTVVYYMDARLYGYYTYALIFGAALTRLLTNLLNSALTAALAIPVLLALHRARLISAATENEDAP